MFSAVGIQFDAAVLSLRRASVVRAADKLQKQAVEVAGVVQLNLRSHKEVSNVLYNVLKLPKVNVYLLMKLS